MSETKLRPSFEGSTKELRFKPPDLSRVAGVNVATIELTEDESKAARDFIATYTQDKEDKSSSLATLAEYVWALRLQFAQDLRSSGSKKEDRMKYLEEDKNARFSVALYRELLAVDGIDQKISDEWQRHSQETQDLNSTYKDYKENERQLQETEDELNTLLADIFKSAGKEPKITQLARRALLETRIATLEKTMQETRATKPDFAAQIEYDTISSYAQQLRTNGFIWTKSRKELLRRVLTGALTSRPVAALMGETGSGKTAMARALSVEIASQEPERTVGGDEEKFKRLLLIPTFDDKGSYRQYGPLLRAITGKDSERDTAPKRSGGVFFDDEFNTRPTSVQREILKFVADIRPGREFSVSGLNKKETALPGFLYLAGGNPPSERYDREETGIETKREFGANVINVEYLDQTADNPELYQILLAGLLDSDTGRLVAVTPDEVQPKWIKEVSTGQKYLSTNPEDGGFLYRFATVWKELFNAFSHKDTALTEKAKKSGDHVEDYYLNEFILDAGVVMSWIDQYKSDLSARNQHIEAFFKEKLKNYLSQFDDEEQDTVRVYLEYFGIKLDEPTPPKPEAKVLTPKEIGFLNPNVSRPREEKDDTEDPPDLETAEIISFDSGESIEYIRTNVGDWQSGTTLKRKEGAPPIMQHEELKILGHLQVDKNNVVCDIGDGTGKIIAYENLKNWYEVPTPETGKPFHYDRKKAREYGMEAVEIPAHAKAQELCDKIIAHDSAFVDGTTLKNDAIKQYWNIHCQDFPNMPEKSWWYFENLASGNIADTIDNDSSTTTTKKHIPHFGEPTFLLAMDFPEFDWDNAQQKQQALNHPSMEIVKKLFNKNDLTAITRDEINTVLWTDHDARTQSSEAKKIIAELLNTQVNDPDINNYELRLIRQDEYARMEQIKHYGKKKLWTHMDGYSIHEDGKRYGLVGGDRAHGGAAHVVYYWRAYRIDANAVRLVLQRKQK